MHALGGARSPFLKSVVPPQNWQLYSGAPKTSLPVPPPEDLIPAPKVRVKECRIYTA